MSARRQATADRPGPAGEPQDRGAQDAQAGQDAGPGTAAEDAGAAESVQAAPAAEATEVTPAGPGAEATEATGALRSADQSQADQTAAGASASDGSRPSRQPPRAGLRKPRAGRAGAKRGPAGRVPAGGASAGTAQSKPAEPLPTRVPASKRRPARPAQDEGPADAPFPGLPGSALAADAAGQGQVATPGLSVRLMALARMIQIGSARSGRDGFSKKLLTDAEDLLGRAGERMRLSSNHTVVALAGGTGSGKSSLFNKLAGADFSTVGVTRPVTREAHACIWGATGSGALIDWLDVPARYRYSRASALGTGEADLTGLVLLDLPDHDSVMGHSGDKVDRLVAMADVLIWVLDPQKYADAAVHRRYLVPMAGHADVVAVVLNQADLLDGGEVGDCVGDLRRLLDMENLIEVPILVTSAVTGVGLDDLHKLLAEAVTARVAATVRISADVDGVVSRLADYAGDTDAKPRVVPEGSVETVAARFARAAGLAAVCDALRGARELRASDFVGWPVTWLLQRLTGRGGLRKVRLAKLWDDLRAVSTGPAGAQQAEIDNALTEFGDSMAAALPQPWPGTVRSAAKSRADAIPAAVGTAIGDSLPAEDSVLWWWRLAGAWQGLLLGVAAVTIVWMALITVFGVLHAAASVPAMFTDTRPLPWIAAGAIVALGLGALTARTCMSLVRRAAERENKKVAADIKERIAVVANEMVVIPAQQELSEFERFRDELRLAQAGEPPDREA